jgi:hypothetical protein
MTAKVVRPGKLTLPRLERHLFLKRAFDELLDRLAETKPTALSLSCRDRAPAA